MALITGLSLSGCGEQGAPARVLNLGLHADSSTGAMIVTEGDMLWEIAQRYRLPVRNIIDLNDLKPPYTLAKGQRLKLPAPVDYRVKSGDTLYNVANMFGVSVSGLVRVNNLPAPYGINPGQNLRIPFSYHHDTPREEMPRFVAAPVAPVTREQEAMVRSPPAASRKGDERKEVHRIALPPVISSSKNLTFIWPVHGKVISGYGPKAGGLYNDGINIAAPRGTPVAAAAEGTVAYVGNDIKSYGNLVLIRHGGGTMTAYAHLGRVNVRKGMAIKKGQAIGTVGSTGAVTSAQLHFEIRQWSKTFDPRQYL